MDPLSTGELAIRIGAAVGLGAMVGLERERKHRPAGFRTMILISLGSCAFTLLGAEAIVQAAKMQAKDGPPVDMGEISRVLQGLIGGIGFLGAGAVIQNKKAVRGLTTAAAVWVTAAIGAACGLGLYVLAALVSGATLFTLFVLEFFENRYFPDPEEWNEKKNGKGDDSSEAARFLRGEAGASEERRVVVVKDRWGE